MVVAKKRVRTRAYARALLGPACVRWIRDRIKAMVQRLFAELGDRYFEGVGLDFQI